MKTKIIFTVFCLSAALCISAAETVNCNGKKSAKMSKDPVYFKHEVKTEKKPWTHNNFGDRGNGQDFSFAIVADRSGRPRPGIFENAIEKINKLRPDFVMSVGDFINGANMERQDEPFFREQWKEVHNIVDKCIPPFFYIVGNHDISAPGGQFPGLHERMKSIWESYFGVTDYYFIYKNTLFLCMNSMAAPGNGFTQKQLEWAKDILKKNPDVRWTFVFFHYPYTWKMDCWEPFEKALYDRNYTVICGDYHQYTKYVRNGRKYFILGTTGGGENNIGKPLRGVVFGEFDHITWVSMCGDKPEFLNLALDGLHDEDVVTTNKITWLTAKYFRANKPLSEEEAKKLKAKGIYIEKEQ